MDGVAFRGQRSKPRFKHSSLSSLLLCFGVWQSLSDIITSISYFKNLLIYIDEVLESYRNGEVKCNSCYSREKNHLLKKQKEENGLLYVIVVHIYNAGSLFVTCEI